MKNFIRPNASLGALLSALVILIGCAHAPPKPVSYPIEVELDAALKGKSVLVDLVGVNPANLDRWIAYSMSSYWKDGDAMRKNATKVSYNFGSSGAQSNRLEAGDPIWAAWLKAGVSRVIVLADLPGAHPDQPGAQDARRQILDLRPDTWEKGAKVLKVLVKESGIDVLTPLRAP